MDERESLTHAKDAFKSFNGMKNDGKYCDFILKIGGEEIPVHRLVLAAYSNYFDAMFQHRMKEAERGFAEILGIEPSAGKQCLEYIYTGKVMFSRENPKDLIHAAELMQLHGLLNLYFEYLVENITPDNCLEYMELALTYNQPSFGKIFEKFLCKNFEKVTKTDGFASINQTLLTQCLECVPAGTLNHEKVKFEAVKAWVNADIGNRRDAFIELFQQVSLEQLPATFLKELISKEDLVSVSDKCRLQLYEALEEVRKPEKMLDVSEDSPTHILAYREESRLLFKYNRDMKSWSRFIRVPRGTIGPHTRILSHKGEIYLVSASGLTKLIKSAWLNIFETGLRDGFCQITSRDNTIYLVTKAFHFEYNTKTDVSKKVKIPDHLRLGPGYAVAASHEFLYAMGGHDTERKAIEFSFSSRTWEPISQMNDQRRNGAAFFFNGKLVAFGGSYSDRYYDQFFEHWAPCEKYCKSVEYYDVSLDRWITLPKSEGKNSFEGYNFKMFVEGNKTLIVRGATCEFEELKLEFCKEETVPVGLHSSFFGAANLN